jgi:hypothetical protein
MENNLFPLKNSALIPSFAKRIVDLISGSPISEFSDSEFWTAF